MTDLATLWAELPAITTMRASGDGRWAFWTCGGLSETDELWGAPTDGSAPAARLTFTEDHLSLRDVSPDGGRVILAQSVHANEPDHLLLFERTSGVLTRLTPVQDSHYLYGGVFTAAGDAVLFLADFDYDSGTVTAGGWLWQQDLTTGARTCLARSDSPFETGPKLSPEGSRILWHRHDPADGPHRRFEFAHLFGSELVDHGIFNPRLYNYLVESCETAEERMLTSEILINIRSLADAA